MRLVAAAHALQERDLFRRLAIRWARDVTLRRAGSRKQPLELERRDDVGVSPQPVLLRKRGVVDFIARSEDDRADLDLLDALEQVVVDRGDAALVVARQTLGAHAARQAARRLGLRFRVGIALAHLVERPLARGHVQRRHLDARRDLDLASGCPLAQLGLGHPHDRQRGHTIEARADGRGGGGHLARLELLASQILVNA